jgi:hypothetical protein
MEVIRHHAKTFEDPSAFNAGLKETFFKGFERTFVDE